MREPLLPMSGRYAFILFIGSHTISFPDTPESTPATGARPERVTKQR